MCCPHYPLMCLSAEEKICTGIRVCVKSCSCCRPGTDAVHPAATEPAGACRQHTDEQTGHRQQCLYRRLHRSTPEPSKASKMPEWKLKTSKSKFIACSVSSGATLTSINSVCSFHFFKRTSNTKLFLSVAVVHILIFGDMLTHIHMLLIKELI